MDFDVVVVGSGAGGGAAAWSLSKAGKRVLVVERGRALGGPLLAHDEQRMLQARPASDDRPLLVNGRLTRLFIGGGLGGSTALYGATFVRPSPRDFEPGRFYGEYLPRAQWDWPIDYAALSPYFGEAERLYSVAGDAAAETPHLGRRATAYPAELPPLEPINRRLAAALRAHGLAPFSLPLAIDFSRCQRCPACPGFGCPTGARMSSVNSCLDPARGTGNLTLWLEHEAQTLITARGSVHTLVVLDRTSGERKQVRASLFVLAAGALGTPLLLMRSGLAAGSGQLGRNHMCHLGAGVALTFARDVGAGERNLKQLGVSDLYFGTRGFRHKLGLIQSIPIPGPLSMRAQLPILPLRGARLLHRRTLLLLGMIEDIPQPQNQVGMARLGRVTLTRRYHRYDVVRARVLARELRRALRGAGALFSTVRVASHDDLHVGHHVGTCRFGHDPEHAVLDRNCRVFDADNLYVVDGSFMPNSLGVGPALTIVANALRVAAHLLKEVA